MDFNEIIRQIAIKNHVAPEEVYAGMQEAIRIGFMNEDPKVKKEWEKIPFKGSCPTPEEMIPALVCKLIS